MARRVGDLVPGASGVASLGVDQTGDPKGGIVFDFDSIAPFAHIHQNSGVFHAVRSSDVGAASGIIRFDPDAGQFEVSVDGGISYQALSAGAGVDSVGVLGDVNLTGNVDFASPASGFIVIEDSGDASPLLWSVDTLGLSGLWGFPANGFPSAMARCYSEDFTDETSLAVSHNIGTTDVVVTVVDNASPPAELTPDSVVRTDANTVTIGFNVPTTGRVTVIGCA